MKIFKLINDNGEIEESSEPGNLGGNRDLRIYGRLDCWSANIYVKKGSYQKARVFFKDEATAIAAGYRPCGHCMRERYGEWAKGGTPGTEGYPWKMAPKSHCVSQ